MQVLRKLAIAFLAFVLFFCLMGTAWSHIGISTLGDRAIVKGWLVESGFYNKIVDAILENVNQGAAENQEQQIPIDDPQVQKIAKEALSPEFLQQNIEEVLDGTYAWLGGETAKPVFSVDLNQAKQKLADGLGNYAISRAASLPTCTPAQMEEMANGGFDILSASCLPPDTDVQSSGAELRNEIISSEDFLKETEFTGDSIKVTSGGEKTTIDQAAEFRRAQEVYKMASYLPYILGFLSLVCALGIVFLSSSKRGGVRRVGVVFLTAGILLGINYMSFKASSTWLNNKAVDLSGDGSNTATQELVRDLVRAISQDVTSLLLWYSLGIGLLGLVAILLSIFVGKPKKGEGKPGSTEPTPPVDDSPKTDPAGKPESTEPKAEDKSVAKPEKKPPRKIQL